MFRYLAGIVLGFLAIFGIWAGLFYASLGLSAEYGDRYPGAWYEIKQSAARDAGTRAKIVLAGGSNVLFGLRAETIARELGRPCVNFGTYAALPLDYLFERLRRILRRGDIVVLAPEWAYLDKPTGEWTDASMAFLLSSDPRSFLQLDWGTQFTGILSAPLKRILLPLILRPEENAAIDNAVRAWVQAKQLNLFGDFVANSPAERPAGSAQKIKRDPRISELQDSAATGDTAFWSRCREFLAWCSERKIRVFYAAPGVFEGTQGLLPGGPPFFTLAENRYQSLGIPVLARQADNFYADGMMFDTTYHLNASGADARTARLIEALRPHTQAMKDRKPR